MAREIVAKENLGESDGAPDLLAIGFSQPDKIGHNYGPHSHELMDSMVRLDRLLAELFRLLDQKVGLARCTLVLTSDHGVAPMPERQPGTGGRIRAAELDARVFAALDAQFGVLANQERWAVRDGLGYHLNPAALAQKQLAPAVVEAAVQQALLKIPAVAAAYIRTQLVASEPLDPFGEATRLSYYPPRSPDVMAVLKPFFIDKAAPGTTHGSPHEYDTHVPLVWFGVGVKPGRYSGRTGVDDLAPTLSRLLGLPPLSQSSGRVLF
jgi:arylsulfatase A-like enzyme